MIKKLEVGSLFREGVTRYPEGCILDFDSSGLILEIRYGKPSSNEVQNIRKGTFSTALAQVDEILFFLFRFGTEQWMDSPFSPHLTAEKDVTPLMPEEDQGYALSIFLIDADTGILKVARMIGLSHEFSLKFREIFIGLKGQSFDRRHYDMTLNATYNAYTSPQLLEMAIERI